MKKEVSRQADSVIFEGLTSINAVLNSENGRRIVTVYFDKDKMSSKRRELSFLRHAAEKYGFKIELTSREEIDAIAVGNSHGGIIVNEDGLTSRNAVYAGGDAVTGAATVISAMGAGKTAAKAIDEALRK